MTARVIESESLPPGFDQTRVAEFAKKAHPIMDKHLRAVLAELEKIWGDRVHCQIMVVPVHTAEQHPMGTLTNNSFGNNLACLQYLVAEQQRIVMDEHHRSMMTAMAERQYHTPQ